MKEIKLLYLYPDMLDLYGDFGNVQILRYRCEKRNIKLTIDEYSVGNEKPDFKSYDIIFAGGGADNEQSILSDDLIKYKNEIKEAYKNKTFLLLICGAYQLFGKYYKGVEGNIVPGLELFDYYTIAGNNRKERCIGNIVTKGKINNEETLIIGFENHGGQTYDIKHPLGKVLCGNGNKFKDEEEGYFEENVIATYLHGPLLSKNPIVADYIISYALNRKYKGEDNTLIKINDDLENECRRLLINKYLKEK